MNTNFDVAVIGAGPGGYVAAIRAAQNNKKVVVFEANHMGGICLNWGCIPTKALLKAAKKYSDIINHASDFGIEVGDVNLNFEKMISSSRNPTKQLSSGVSSLMKKHGITVVPQHAKLEASNKIAAGGKVYSANNIIIASGARPKTLPNLLPDGDFIWNYKHAMTPKCKPKSLVVVGSGAIGVEFANFYNMIGVDVTIVEINDRILKAEDEEISELAAKSFKKQGIEILTSSKVLSVDKKSREVTVELHNGKTKKFKPDAVISAIGISPNIEEIGIQKLGVKLDEQSFIKTNNQMQTNLPGVYAIGDVTQGPWLAHKASHEGIIAADALAGKHAEALDRKQIPGCTYCYPQIASIGLTEAQAIEQGYQIRVGRFPLYANGKAIASQETEGMVKNIFDKKTGELLGAHMIGAEVTEMIQGYGIAMKLETTHHELMETIFAHPTISEAMHEAVLDAYGIAIHI